MRYVGTMSCRLLLLRCEESGAATVPPSSSVFVAVEIVDVSEGRCLPLWKILLICVLLTSSQTAVEE